LRARRRPSLRRRSRRTSGVAAQLRQALLAVGETAGSVDELLAGVRTLIDLINEIMVIAPQSRAARLGDVGH
jgi:hypothetical protein